MSETVIYSNYAGQRGGVLWTSATQIKNISKKNLKGKEILETSGDLIGDNAQIYRVLLHGMCLF